MPRVLAKHKKISLVTSLFFLLGFCSFILVALSLPITKPIWLYVIHAEPVAGQPKTSTATDLKFGVWGFCTKSKLDPPSSYGKCFGPQLGFAGVSLLSPQLLASNKLIPIAIKTLTALLLLHPICAFLSLMTSFTSLFLVSWKMRITTFATCLLTCVLVTIVTAVDLTLISVAKKELGLLRQAMGANGFNVSVDWGAGPWMMLGGVLLSYIGLVLLIVVFIKERRERQLYRRVGTNESQIELMDTLHKSHLYNS